MKKVTVFFALCLITWAPTQAQLLNKLKEKASKALNGSKQQENKSSNSNEEDAVSKPTNNKTAAKKDWIDEANCKVVFTLDGATNERLMYDEVSVTASNNQLSYAFVTVNKNREYFLIENGKRSGPFKESPLASLKKDDNEDNNEEEGKVSMGNDQKDPVAIQYSKTIGGKLHLVFNGKNYGPYDHVAKMVVSPDKKKFFALVTIGGANAMTAKMGMGNSFLVNEGTLKQKLAGPNAMPMRLLISSGFKQAMGIIMDQSTQKILTVTTAGKKTEGTMEQLYTNGGLLKVSDAGDIISIPAQSPTQVLVNGDEAASFQVPITNANRLFLTPDIKKSVYYQKGKLYHGDGTTEDVSYITFPSVVTVNGESALYYYKMKKNDSGDTEVYLCKKVL